MTRRLFMKLVGGLSMLAFLPQWIRKRLPGQRPMSLTRVWKKMMAHPKGTMPTEVWHFEAPDEWEDARPRVDRASLLDMWVDDIDQLPTGAPPPRLQRVI